MELVDIVSTSPVVDGIVHFGTPPQSQNALTVTQQLEQLGELGAQLAFKYIDSWLNIEFRYPEVNDIKLTLLFSSRGTPVGVVR